MANLTQLTYLSLSSNNFSGSIPTSIGNLKQLTNLYLDKNRLSGSIPSSMANLTQLRYLWLSFNNFSNWTLPAWLGTLSKLTELYLQGTNLNGHFPTEIFHLPKLKSLSVRFNPNLTGILPEFPKGSPLEDLELQGTDFSGNLPNSIGNLEALRWLDLNKCSFSGTIPTSLGNLERLTYLSLNSNNFSGSIPTSIGNLKQLTTLDLDGNRVSGSIPSSLANLTQLTYLSFYSNNLSGSIPNFVFELLNLEILDFAYNSLSGRIEFGEFTKLLKLTFLDLSGNKLSVLSNTFSNGTFPKFNYLGLGSCNIFEFPDFLRSQDEMKWLDISNNRIHGLIPKWVWNISTTSLYFMDLYNNFLTGFEQQPSVLPWKMLNTVNLNGNSLQGILPIPRASIQVYKAAYNSFSGNLSSFFCNLNDLFILDLSNNNLSGSIPQCLGTSNMNLSVLNLQGNHFYGAIPRPFRYGSQLRAIYLGHNQLLGELPRSLANCTMLESLDISQNQITDSFPTWLGVLPNLKILLLGSNQFYGGLGGLGYANVFPNLKIWDLSHNDFSGHLPAEFFHNLVAMKSPNMNNFSYMKVAQNIEFLGTYTFDYSFKTLYTTEVTSKGVETLYTEIPEALKLIDLSSNRFSGPIPESTGDLRGLKVLNLSHNCLTSLIPQSFGNLTELESLDLSKNSLSGQIPEQLTRLTFLGVFNVSFNNLSGFIPHGKQFDTFQNDSYVANPGLCGNPLSKRCENFTASSLSSQATPERDEDSRSTIEFDWLVISMGYLSGLIIGWEFGCFLTARRHEWFVETFGKR